LASRFGDLCAVRLHFPLTIFLQERQVTGAYLMSLDCGSARRQTADQSGLQPAVFEGDSFDRLR
jgi:hypothetical protein